MKKLLGVAALVLMLALVLPASRALAAGPLDQIKSYTVTVDPRRDGTLDITYHIDWLVLDSTSEGPLTWVKIGIPNSHVDSIKALSDSIFKIGYLNDNGSYVRLDLNRAYTAGETVALDFSLHQSWMYRLDGENNVCSYTFVPGWFDSITVDALTVRWNKANVLYSDSTAAEGDYLVWRAALEPGDRCVAIVRYGGGVLDTDPAAQYVEEQRVQSDGGMAPLAVVGVIIFLIVIAVASTASRYRGGFRGGGGYHGGGRSCACASSCACACACACAGGGRAGCSAKNFYSYSVSCQTLSEKLTGRQGH